MPLHNVRWRMVASGVDEVQVFANALEWLCGFGEAVEIETTKSYHGSELNIITANLEKRGQARISVAHLGAEVLQEIIADLEKHIDEENKKIHIRLHLDSLFCGVVKLGEMGEKRCLKGQIKLQVYPGDNIFDVAEKLLLAAIERSIRQGWPERLIQAEAEEE